MNGGEWIGSIDESLYLTHYTTEDDIRPNYGDEYFYANNSKLHRIGHHFVGWNPNTIPVGSTGDKTFTAIWGVLTYELILDANYTTSNE